MRYFKITTIVVFILTANCLIFKSTILAQSNIPSKIKIEGILNAGEKDSIEVLYRACKLPPESIGHTQNVSSRIPISYLGKFKFEITERSPFYLTLIYKSSKGNKIELFNSYLAEHGDDIFLSFKTKFMSHKGKELLKVQKISFSGKGAEKYTCQYAIEQNEKVNLSNWQNRKRLRVDTGMNTWVRNATLFATNLENGNLKIIDRQQLAMSDLAYQILRINLFSKKMIEIYRQLLPISKRIRGLKDDFRYRFLVQYYLATEKPADFSNNLLPLSSSYTSYLLLKYEFEALALNNTERLTRIYNISDQSLKERVLTEYMLIDFTRFADPDLVVNNALENITDKDYIKLIQSMVKAQSKGVKVFDFSLPDTNGGLIKLSNYLGKIVFLDFWFTGCGGCAIYHKSILSKVEKKFQNDTNVVFIAISIDIDKEIWLRSVKEGLYTSPTAVNLYTNGLGTNHPLIKQLAVTAYPRPIIIDKEGRLFNNKRDDLRKSPERLSAVLVEAISSN